MQDVLVSPFRFLTSTLSHLHLVALSSHPNLPKSFFFRYTVLYVYYLRVSHLICSLTVSWAALQSKVYNGNKHLVNFRFYQPLHPSRTKRFLPWLASWLQIVCCVLMCVFLHGCVCVRESFYYMHSPHATVCFLPHRLQTFLTLGSNKCVYKSGVHSQQSCGSVSLTNARTHTHINTHTGTWSTCCLYEWCWDVNKCCTQRVYRTNSCFCMHIFSVHWGKIVWEFSIPSLSVLSLSSVISATSLELFCSLCDRRVVVASMFHLVPRSRQ